MLYVCILSSGNLTICEPEHHFFFKKKCAPNKHLRGGKMW